MDNNDDLITIQKNRVGYFQFTLKDDDDNILMEADEDRSYVHGHGALIVGLENALEGHKNGDEFSVAIPPAQAYGEHSPDLERVFGIDKFDMGDDEPEIGMTFDLPSNTGFHRFRVVGIEGKNIAADGNHPWAGMTLHYDIKVTGVRDAKAEEIEKKAPIEIAVQSIIGA
ncbi:MAG: peptidylprolyl isomerase [Gammaproteobacteria bacterium]|nr:peptidylprolyl isomerase [Gammaproteobacteria bacterium]